MPGASPLLSITLPVYNGERYLATSLGSVSDAVAALPESRRREVEVVLCDDYSTDRTAELARRHAPPCAYRIIRPPEFFENRTRNWHHALSASQAPWMMMLHADDMLVPDGLPALLDACGRYLDRAPVVLIAGRHRAFTNDGKAGRLQPAWRVQARIPGRILRRLVLPYHCPFVPFTVMRRSTYEEIGGLNDRYHLLQDWELWIRILDRGDLAFVPAELGWWRTHAVSDEYAMRMAGEMLILSREMARLIPEVRPRRWPWLRRVHLTKARAILPDHIPSEAIAWSSESAALPSPSEARATMRRVRWSIRLRLLRALLAGTAAPA
jgi:glycosyltransferase involved in cell wall biosynthesis